MSVHYDLPKGSILSRKLPTKDRLPKSTRVQDAYMHAFELRNGHASAIVRLHVRVRTYAELQKTLKWKMEEISASTHGCAEFILTPAGKNVKVTILGIGVEAPESGSNAVRLRFDDHAAINNRGHARKQSQLLRPSRVLRAEHDASRIFAPA